MNKVIFSFNRIVLLTLSALLPILVNGSNTASDSVFSTYEKKLSNQAIELSKIRFNDVLSDSLSTNLSKTFNDVLAIEGSINYPFDSLQGIGKVESNDKKLRIFTWNSVRNDGTYIYYGFIQIYLKDKKETKVYRLIDKSDSIPTPERASLIPNNWYGALYYEIVETKLADGKILYTLLGWDGNNLYSNKKVIESLTFTASGKPKFGKLVFRVDKLKQKRIIFEYSRMANMMIKYDKEMDMIVYDHLSPSNPTYQNNRAFYGPDFSYDGFVFENFQWKHVSEIDYKNTPENHSKSKKKRRK